MYLCFHNRSLFSAYQTLVKVLLTDARRYLSRHSPPLPYSPNTPFPSRLRLEVVAENSRHGRGIEVLLMHIPQLVNLKISIPITPFGDSKPLDGKPVRSAYQSEISCRPRARKRIIRRKWLH